MDREEMHGDCEWGPRAFTLTHQGDRSRVIRESPAQQQPPQMHLVPTRRENKRGKLAERCSQTGWADNPRPTWVQQNESTQKTCMRL